jgi:hypothetical protein
VSSQAVISVWDIDMGTSFALCSTLLTGDSQPGNRATSPAAGRQPAFCQVISNRPHPCPVVHGMVFALSNSFAVSGHKTSVEPGHLCSLEKPSLSV